MLSSFIRRILGAIHFPHRPMPLEQIEPQVYQPPLVPKGPAPLVPPPKEPNHGLSE